MPGRLSDVSLMFSFFKQLPCFSSLFIALVSSPQIVCVHVCLGEGDRRSGGCRVLLKIAKQHSKLPCVLAKKGTVKKKKEKKKKEKPSRLQSNVFRL